MSYLIIKNNNILHTEDLRMEDFESAKKGLAMLINTNTLSFFDGESQSWCNILTVENKKNQELFVPVIGELEIFKIKNLAQLNLMSRTVPEDGKRFLREFFLFDALREFLIGLKCEPGFKMKNKE